MTTLLLIAALGQWTHAGWFADPPKAKPVVVKPAPPPAPAVAPKVAEMKARTEPYRRKDASGQSWRYPPEGSTREVVPMDLEILDAFVRGRNSVLEQRPQAAPAQTSPAYFAPQSFMQPAVAVPCNT